MPPKVQFDASLAYPPNRTVPAVVPAPTVVVSAPAPAKRSSNRRIEELLKIVEIERIGIARDASRRDVQCPRSASALSPHSKDAPLFLQTKQFVVCSLFYSRFSLRAREEPLGTSLLRKSTSKNRVVVKPAASHHIASHRRDH